MSDKQPNNPLEPEPKPNTRKPRRKLKDMTPEELAEREARKAARDKAWMREHRPHIAATVALFFFGIAGVTGAGSSDVSSSAQTEGAEILLIFSAIPRALFGVDGAIILFIGLGVLALVVAVVLWARLRLEKTGGNKR